ncbi:MAG: Uma2 family endonuclease [Caldilineaceae bacterium]|nr:Uma2 family endonuclease [Caldilineaceae bacterium]
MSLLTKPNVTREKSTARPEFMAELPRLEVQFDPVIQMDDDQFFEFCQLNRDLRIERTATGKVLIMSPAGGETGSRNAELTLALRQWAKRDQRGVAFDSSTGFILPNGAIRSPDAAWVQRERLTVLSPQQKRKFLPLCPDFVVELRSATDQIAELQEKMQEYLANGAQLGWLLIPETRDVYIYRPQTEPLYLQDPAQISGEPFLPGLVITLAELWDPGF